MHITDHRLDGVRFIPSPNTDPRPDPADISLLVVHCISLPPGKFGGSGVTELFTNHLDPAEHTYYEGIAHLRVSAHCVICRTGEIIQYVPFDQRAWHAGASGYQGRTVCNNFSIGIELEGTDDTPYEAIQYQRLNELIDALLAVYPTLSRQHITGHEHIAPGRKTDPGACFDWSQLGNGLPAVETRPGA